MIFISYQSSQLTLAEYLVSQLEQRGLRAWYAHRDIPPGSVWDEAIMDAIGACDAFVLLFSDGSDGSLQVKREVMLAESEGKPVFWLKTDAAEPRKLRYYLIARQWAEWDPAKDLPTTLLGQLRIEASPGSAEPSPASIDVTALEMKARQAKASGDAQACVEALRILAAALTNVHGANHPDTLTTRYQVAYYLGETGDTAGALLEHKAVADARTRVLGADHAHTLTSRSQVAHYLGVVGDKAGALREHQAVVTARTRVLGADHPDTLTSRYMLAYCLGETGDKHAALREHQAVVTARTRVLGADHPDTLTSRGQVARYLGETGDRHAALREHQAVVTARTRVLGADHPDTLDSIRSLERLRRRMD